MIIYVLAVAGKNSQWNVGEGGMRDCKRTGLGYEISTKVSH